MQETRRRDARDMITWPQGWPFLQNMEYLLNHWAHLGETGIKRELLSRSINMPKRERHSVKTSETQCVTREGGRNTYYN
ncbi:hypothetical protein M404DRAFT_541322 [Pisolithus tinctorius Marx 270]|uniref:Uncharacterized protein n=1 Tax=Pisolithus tinctorius Marx 270 TaxID=870435 RepID=A0A0C3K5G4_PISTI|nr:hypothetical protein M404DRAFT_541322 [Pisolithus tinctorius Marx 270]